MATNAGGVRVLRFGPMRAQLRGIEAVLADGTVVSHLAEHGIGALKARWLPLARTEAERGLFARIRSALDPAGTLNPHVLPILPRG